MLLTLGCILTISLTTHIADGNRPNSHKNMTFVVQGWGTVEFSGWTFSATLFSASDLSTKPHAVQNLVDIFVQTTFKRELRPHSPLYVTFSYILLGNCTTKDAYEYQVPQPSSAAGKRRNASFYTLRVSYKTYAMWKFHESCLDDFNHTVRKRDFIPSVVWPLLYVRSCWCFRVLQFLVTLTMGRNKNTLAGHSRPCETCLLNSLLALEKTKRIKKDSKILPWTVG